LGLVTEGLAPEEFPPFSQQLGLGIDDRLLVLVGNTVSGLNRLRGNTLQSFLLPMGGQRALLHRGIALLCAIKKTCLNLRESAKFAN
jgi:hypothetical protein